MAYYPQYGDFLGRTVVLRTWLTRTRLGGPIISIPAATGSFGGGGWKQKQYKYEAKINIPQSSSNEETIIKIIQIIGKLLASKIIY